MVRESMRAVGLLIPVLLSGCAASVPSHVVSVPPTHGAKSAQVSANSRLAVHPEETRSGVPYGWRLTGSRPNGSRSTEPAVPGSRSSDPERVAGDIELVSMEVEQNEVEQTGVAQTLPAVPPAPSPPAPLPPGPETVDSRESAPQSKATGNSSAESGRDESRRAPAESDLQWNGEFSAAEVSLEDVIHSVYQSYPKLEAALADRGIAAGDRLAAWGNFDLKLKGESRNQPLGYYETYRHSVGAVQPVMHGGQVFGGYRIGRGHFEPWYKERQTNDGGEFKAGVEVPFARDRRIDERRAELWRTGFGQQLVDAEIQGQLIEFVRDASYAYWFWVAAGRDYRIAERVLSLAEDRTERIRRQVEEQLTDPPVLTDNLRLVAERKAKLAETSRKLQQAAIKLSMYLRDADGMPVIADAAQLPDFPEIPEDSQPLLDADVDRALAQRPEQVAFDFQRRQLQVDRNEASNGLLPTVDGYMTGSQDLGEPTSKKRDKSEFELEAGLLVDVPLQRRKARGKLMAVEAKLAQLSAKQRLMRDAIVVEVRSAHAALTAAVEQAEQAREAVELAEDVARRERRSFELGASDLLKVTLREQYAAESATKEVGALLVYWLALADYRAAVGDDRLQLGPPGAIPVPPAPPLCILPD